MLKFIPAAIMAAFFILPAGAATIPFRSGEVLDAQISSVRPSISNWKKFDFQLDFSEQRYALVTVTVTPGRSISIHDYALEVFGRKYPCIALCKNGGAFDGAKWEFSSLGRSDKVGLLFVFDGSVAGFNDVENFKLVSNAPGKYPAMSIPFVNRQKQSFNRNVPAGGSFKGKF